MKIAWLNDVQAPYREPMMSELANLVEFEASFFFAEEKLRHWEWRAHSGYRSAVVPAWRLPAPHELGRRLGEDVGLLRPGTTRRILRDVDALVTQVWWQPANLAAILGCRRRGIPYLLFAESTVESRSLSGGPADRLRTWVFRNAGAVIVPGSAAAKAAILNGTPADRVVESVNSIDVELYGEGVRARRSGDAGGPHRFTYVGQLIERKNVATLLRAFAGIEGEPILEIAGDGEQLPALRELAAELGIAARVRFLGFLEEPDVIDLLARNHTLVLPSTEEVYGFTALEAHVAGLQVVVSDVAGVASSMVGRRGTWLVPPTAEGLTSALTEAVAAWTGWFEDVDVDFASPTREAKDIVAAAEMARSRPRTAAERRVHAARTGLSNRPIPVEIVNEQVRILDADRNPVDLAALRAEPNPPAVSVCIPLYKKERFVARTIQSVLDQTFTDFELVIVHNDSPDRSAEIAASFDDPRIRIYHNESTVSGSENHVRAAMLARAPLVKLCAADDLLHPTVLEKQVAVMADPTIAVSSCRQNMIGEHDEVMYRDRSLRAPDLIGKQSRETVVRRVVRHTGNPVGAYVNIMFRRSAYEAVGGIPDVPFMAQDVGFALHVARAGDFYGIPETLVDFRIASGSASASDGEDGIAEQVQFIRLLRAQNREILRLRDRLYGGLREPLMRQRHRLIVAAAGAADHPRTRAATRILSLSRRSK